MPLYTLYPCKADGSSETFHTMDLSNDTEAYARALEILDQHPSCTQVVAWCGERKAVTRTRLYPDGEAVVAQAPTRK